MHERLQLARERAGYDTATEAAEDLGFVVPTYLAHENGSRGFRRSVQRYARAFGVRWEWLLEESGPMKSGAKHPIVELYERVPEEDQPEARRYLEYLASRKS